MKSIWFASQQTTGRRHFRCIFVLAGISVVFFIIRFLLLLISSRMRAVIRAVAVWTM